MAGEDRKLQADEERRTQQHERIKGEVREEIHEEIEKETHREDPSEKASVERTAHELKERALREVSEEELELDRARRAARISQVVDYCFYVLYGLIGLQIVLELLGAREWAGFKKLINLLTWPLLAPFRGLMPDPAVGSMQLMLSYIIGLGVYILLHMAINGGLRLFVKSKMDV